MVYKYQYLVTDLKRTLADVYEQQEEWQKSAKMLLSAGFEYSESLAKSLFIRFCISKTIFKSHLRYLWSLDSVIMTIISNYRYI